jgi:hypothetical protein
MLSPKEIIERQVVTMDVINLDAKPLFFDPNYDNSCIIKMLKCNNPQHLLDALHC